MPLKLMYITNKPEIACIAERNDVDRIFVDMEYIGKSERQRGLNSVQNHHTVEDVVKLRKVLNRAELLVRVNPIHEETFYYCSSEKEIDDVINAGADIVMLPYYKTVREVERFLKAVSGRCRTMLLLETAEALKTIEDTLSLDGIDEIHIGINDLSIALGKKFMFELLVDGTVEYLCRKMETKGKFYGFGGIASLGCGLIPAEMIIKEHYRLGSGMAILSRSFCNADEIQDLNIIEEIFSSGVQGVRKLEKECEEHIKYFSENRKELKTAVENVVLRKGK